MSKKIDGIGFKNMVDYAVRNLNKHVKAVNQLNVFPVPDGDTGTNMVTTIHKGLMGVGEKIVDLPSISRKFARSVVFEARGNSGVIVSQFLKGIAERFYDVQVVDGRLFIEALEKGVEYAYASVATPVEGTMLTVIKDATASVKAEFDGTQGVKDIIDSFVAHAKKSLENTPELLAVLKESGVVDSGGAGVVYLFEGMKKYLDGEPLEVVEADAQTAAVDYDAFNRTSRFEYGYCTELLVQLLDSAEPFEYEAFRQTLTELGDSLVVSAENDKVRIHIHTRTPEKIFSYCHRFGEFLTAKIENMTVQHTELSKRILCSDGENSGAYCVVAVACDERIQKLFLEMGADVVICGESGVSTKDYLDAFKMCQGENIVVFPNSSDGILSAMQAKKLCQQRHVAVLNSRSIAECYAALPTLSFEETDMEQVIDGLTEIINNLYVVSIAKRERTATGIAEYYSFSGKELLIVGDSLLDTVQQTIIRVVKQQRKEIVTIFHGPSVSQTQIEELIAKVGEQGLWAEFFTVSADNLPSLMTISFE